MSIFIPVGDTASSTDGYASIAQAFAYVNSTIYNSVLFWVLSAGKSTNFDDIPC